MDVHSGAGVSGPAASTLDHQLRPAALEQYLRSVRPWHDARASDQPGISDETPASPEPGRAGGLSRLAWPLLAHRRGPAFAGAKRASRRATPPGDPVGCFSWETVRVDEVLPELILADAAGWRAWLGDNHAQEPGVWLVLAKKGATVPTRLTYEGALEEALCHGWIDGQTKRRDELTYRQRFTPRRARERMVAAQRRRSSSVSWPKIECIQRAWPRSNGPRRTGDGSRPTPAPSKIEVPADLDAALAAEPRARAMFEILTSQNRYAVLYRLQTCQAPRDPAATDQAVCGDARPRRDDLPTAANSPGLKDHAAFSPS